MPIDWALISVALAPHLKTFTDAMLKRLASELSDKTVAKTCQKLLPQAKLQNANAAFVHQFSRELTDSNDFTTLNDWAYGKQLEAFLSNDYVQHQLIKPLDGTSRLDVDLLGAIWNETKPTPDHSPQTLPSSFSWLSLQHNYESDLRSQMLADPELREVLIAVSALKTSELSTKHIQLLQSVSPIQRTFDKERYAEATKKAFGWLKIGSIDTDWTDYEKRIRLEHVYVPQSVKQALPTRDVTRDYLRSDKRGEPILAENTQPNTDHNLAYSQSPRLNIMSVIDDQKRRHVVIIGDPGLGKSTLLRRLALRWCSNQLSPFTALLELRRIDSTSSRSPFLEYFDHGSEATCCLPQLDLHDYLCQNDSLLLFDGLDEVDPKHRSSIVEHIIKFCQDYPRARVVVTTRIQGYHPGSTHPETFRDAGFQQFTLQDFETDEILEFIHRWHAEAFVDMQDRKRYEWRLRSAVMASPAIRELASNPLLLTMMAILSRNQDLPRDRGRLYERCAELLLKNWDLEKFPDLKTRKEVRDIKDKLGPDQKMRLLELVANAMGENGPGLAANVISEPELKRVVQRELDELDVQQSWSVTDDLILMLRERNFMLAYLGDSQYGFIHRTFLEYFYARHFKTLLERTSTFNSNEIKALFENNWRREEWHEILRLLCGLIGSEYAGACVRTLLETSQAAENRGAIFLAVECLAEIREVKPIKALKSDLRNAFVQSFDLTSDSQDLRTKGADDPFIVNRIAAIRWLGRYWGTDAEVSDVLKKTAEQSGSPRLRYAAILEIANTAGKDEQTILWLKRRASQEESALVRRGATERVASICGGVESKWIIERVKTDVSSTTSSAVLNALMERYETLREAEVVSRNLEPYAPPGACALELCLIGQGKFSAAKEYLSKLQSKGDHLQIRDAFNFAIADWGLQGHPSIDLFQGIHDLSIKDGVSMTGSNYYFCLAIVEGVLGNDSLVEVNASRAELLIEERGSVFSPWSYLYRGMRDFQAEINAFRTWVRDGIGMPYVKNAGLE